MNGKISTKKNWYDGDYIKVMVTVAIGGGSGGGSGG